MENIIKRSIVGDNGEKIELQYEIIVDKIRSEDGLLLGEILGIRVKSSTNGEEQSVRFITTDCAKMERIFDIVTRGLVTPVTLPDVVSDLLN